MKYGLSYITKKVKRSFVNTLKDSNWKEELYDTSRIELPREESSLPKISVVMPSFNQVDYIERSLLSIINQRYPNYEIIVIDGGSTDGTTDIIEKYEPYIACSVSEKDRGQSDALNKGFKKATGDIFCWMNSDDIFMPGVFHKVSTFFAKGYPVVFGDVLVVSTEDVIEDYQIAFPFTTRQFIYDGFVHNAQSMFWKKDVHEKFGAFREDLYYTMDYDFIVRVCRICPPSTWKFLPEPIGAFRCYEGQKTGQAHEKAMLEHRKTADRLGFPDKFEKKGRRLKWVYYANRHLWFFIRYGRMLIKRKLSGVPDEKIPENAPIWIHTTAPSPYRRHLFEKIAEHFPGSKAFFVLDMTHKLYRYRPWENDSRSWNIETIPLNPRIPLPKKMGFVNPGLIVHLFRQPKNTIHLVGSVYTNWLVIMLCCRFFRGKYVVWNDAGFPERVKNIENTLWYRHFRKTVSAAFSPGKLGVLFSSKIGIPEDRIYNAYFSHDMAAFSSFYHEKSRDARREIRGKLGISKDHTVILCISRFLELKRLVDLAEALLLFEKKYPELCGKTDLILIGDGEEKAHEETLSMLKTIRVCHEKSVPYPEIKAWYSAADIFVFPSEGDIWGLVVNEALSLGLPVICTEPVGASELVKDGWNGFVVPPRRPEMIMDRLHRMVSDKTLYDTMKKNAVTIHETWHSDLAISELKRLVADIDPEK